MPHIVVASTNPVKIRSALAGFQRLFPEQSFTIEGTSVPSDVADQPMSEEETRAGAANRCRNAREALPAADYWVGIEGGVAEDAVGLQALAWIAISDAAGNHGYGRSGSFYLPPQVADLVRAGKELGEADDIVFKKTNSKQANGAIGLLTGDALTRDGYYEEAVIFGLVALKNPQLFPGGL